MIRWASQASISPSRIPISVTALQTLRRPCTRAKDDLIGEDSARRAACVASRSPLSSC